MKPYNALPLNMFLSPDDEFEPEYVTVGNPAITPKLLALLPGMKFNKSSSENPVETLLSYGFYNLLRTDYKNSCVEWDQTDVEKLVNISKFTSMDPKARALQRTCGIDFRKLDENKHGSWKVLSAFEDMSKTRMDNLNMNVHPLLASHPSAYDSNSLRVLEELTWEFQLFTRTNAYQTDMLYFGKEPLKIQKWMDNRPEVNFSYVEFNGTNWKNIYSNDAEYQEELVLFESKLKDYALNMNLMYIFLDAEISDETLLTRELINNYLLFQQLFLAHKYLKEGGEITIRIPDMYHDVTRQILALFAVYFESYRIVKPTALSLGDNSFYITYSTKRELSMNMHYTAVLSLYYEFFKAFNRVNIKENFAKCVLSELFDKTTIFYRELEPVINKFELFYQENVEFMRSNMISINAFDSKNYELSEDCKKSVSKIYHDNMRHHTELEKMSNLYHSEIFHTIPERQLIFIENFSDSLQKVLDGQPPDVWYEDCMKHYMKSVVQFEDFPKQDMLTQFGSFHTTVMKAIAIAYDRGSDSPRTNTLEVLSQVTNVMKMNIIQACDFLKFYNVFDLGCGKGVDIQKYAALGVKKYFGIDISQKQISAFKRRSCVVNFPKEIRLEDFTTGRKIAELEPDSMITAFHTFSMLCSHRDKLITWLTNNLCYVNTFLMGSYLSDTVLKNRKYKEQFNVKAKGRLLNFSIPGLVDDTYEYCLNDHKLKELINLSGFKMVTFDYKKFKFEDDRFRSVYPLIQDLKFIIIYRKDYIIDARVKAFIANMGNSNFSY